MPRSEERRIARFSAARQAFRVLDSLFVPAPEKDSRWRMLVLHGLGDSLAGYRWLPDALNLPWLHYRLINAPDHYFGGYSWYDFNGDPAPGIERSRQAITRLLDEPSDFPPEKTFLFGFSQGCLMTWEVGLSYPKRLAGCIGISGYVHQPERLMQKLTPVALQQRFLITHGEFDSLIPIDRVRPQVRLLTQAGLRVEWKEFPKEHTIAGEKELRVIRDFIQACRTEAQEP